MIYYTGIGSRETPKQVCETITRLASLFAIRKYLLRSGAAAGADEAFEHGHTFINQQCQIFLPWKNFVPELKSYYIYNFNKQIEDQALKIASEIHPAWSKCSPGAKKLHTRNIYQVLGPNLNEPSAFVIGWTKDGKFSGGTRTAMILAEKYNIPVINLNTNPFDKMLPYELLMYVEKNFLTK